MTTFRARMALLVLTLTLCSACGDESTDAGVGALSPVSTSSTDTTATSAGSSKLGPVSLTLPTGFNTVEVPSTQTVHRFGARGTVSADGVTAPALAVVVQDAPRRRAKAEAEAGAELARRTVPAAAATVTVKQIRLAGANDAWSLDYDEPGDIGATSGRHNRSVIADLGSRLVVIQTVASVAEYPGSGLETALSSARLIP